MRKYFQPLALISMAFCTMFANAGQNPSYLNFILEKNISDFSITVDDSCEGSGTPVTNTTGFYKNNNYYLKVVQGKQADSKVCRDNLKPNLKSNTFYGTTNYFPVFPDGGSYANTLSSGDLLAAYQSCLNDYVVASYKDFLPQSVLFSVTGKLNIRWTDTSNDNISVTAHIPVTFALGQTRNRKDYNWFVISGEEPKGFILPGGYYEKGPNGHKYVRDYYTGITVYDPLYSQYFCLSNNLKGNDTLKVNIGACVKVLTCEKTSMFGKC